MPLTLRRGGESRLDGAPDQLLPPFADGVEALAQAILADDTDNVYGGDINLARQIARQQLGEMSDRSRAGQAAAAQAGADRDRARAAVRGVDPESLPSDEYGAVPKRTVREANRPPKDAEAALMQDQGLADEITAGLRTGDQNWQAEADRQYSQEYGLGGFEHGPGQTDLDIRRRIQGQQGFIRTQQGMVPMGRDPTPEQIENYRNFHEKWANETPGSERQARYNPEAYEEFREGVRQDIQDNARKDKEAYGTGVTDPAVRADLGLAPLAPEQQEARARRQRSEDRVAEAEREVRIARLARQAGVTRAEARAMMDKERAGMQPAGAAPLPLNAAQRRQETQGLRDRAGTRRDAELAARQEALRSQRMLLAPGGRGMVNAINELPDEWRNIAILDRITQGRVGGPTPLGVDAVGAQNALRFLNNEAIAGMDPLKRQQAQAMLDMQRRQNMPELAGQADIAAGNPQTPEAVAHLNSLAGRFDDTYFGFSYENEMALAAELQKPPYNMPQAEAEATAYRLAEKRRWLSGGTPGGRPRAGAAPAAPPPPPPGEGGPSGLDFAPPGGDMSF
jgi:hypothetical protein